MRIAEYKQIDTQTVTETIRVEDVVDGEVVGWREEAIFREVPVMGMAYRDATPEEEAEAEQDEDTNREPTFEERMEAQIMYTALMTDTLIEEV